MPTVEAAKVSDERTRSQALPVFLMRATEHGQAIDVATGRWF